MPETPFLPPEPATRNYTARRDRTFRKRFYVSIGGEAADISTMEFDADLKNDQGQIVESFTIQQTPTDEPGVVPGSIDMELTPAQLLAMAVGTYTFDLTVLINSPAVSAGTKYDWIKGTLTVIDTVSRDLV